MNGTLAQILSLISYGNQFLNSERLPENYYPRNVAFKFCNQVNFLHLETQSGGNIRETEVAADPANWLIMLKQNSCSKLSAYYHPSEPDPARAPDHKLAGFVGGGGTWLIEAVYPSHSEFWGNRWKVTHQDDPQQNIWSVNYGRTVAQAPTIDFRPDVSATKQSLAATLTAVKAFALKQQLDNWTGVFDRALKLLESAAPAEGWYEQLIDTSAYSLIALQLLYSAMSSYVFGGMGSWNDLVFDRDEDNRTYEELSAQLYDRVNRALLSGINSFPV